MANRSMQLMEQPAGERLHRKTMDSPTLMVTLMLIVTGLIALYTASYANAFYYMKDPLYYISRQMVFVAVGVPMMLFVSNIPYKIYGRLQKPLFTVALFLNLITKFVGREVKGAVRWIFIGPINFQPSEIMKIALIFSFAWYASRPTTNIRKMRTLVPYMGALVAIAACLRLQKHMSATVIITMIGLIILFAAGMKIWYFFPLGAAGGAAAVWYIRNNQYALQRIQGWLDPFIDIRDTGWQAAMSHIAIGSGGLWGLGLGQGRQKHLYLPEPQNDFIFSAFCEELGFFGAMLVIIMFAYLICRGLHIARCSRDKFGCLIAVGITSKLAIQTLMNLFVVSGIFPVTGASLPFFSAGGTALLMQLFEIGVLLNVSRNMVAGSS